MFRRTSFGETSQKLKYGLQGMN